MKKIILQTMLLIIATSTFPLALFANPVCLGFDEESATKNGCTVNVHWKYDQCNIGIYYVMYSLNSGPFYPIGVINARNTNNIEEYTFTDNYACPGGTGTRHVVYRIQYVYGGTVEYSNDSPVTWTSSETCSGCNTNSARCASLPTLSISGDNAICTSSSETYTFSNNYYPVSWSITSGSNLVSINSSDPYQITISNGSSTATSIVLNANVYGCTNITKTIFLGLPKTPGNIVGLNPPLAVSPSEILELDADDEQMPSYNWSALGGTISGSSTLSHVTVQVDQCPPFVENGYINVYLTYGNSCGTGTQYGEWTSVDCGTGGGLRIRITPNPVKSYLNISIDGESKLLTIKTKASENIQFYLHNIFTNEIVRQWKLSSGQNQYSLNLIGLKKGLYVLEVVKGGVKQSKQVLIQ